MNIRILLPALASLALAACATAPKPLQGQFSPLTPQQTLSTDTAQATASVRWGGQIIETEPGANQTCFQVLSRPLNSMGRPMASASDASEGRFLACRTGFYDPAVFQPGRDVTFIGRVDGQQSVKIGEYDYRLPRLAAEVVYLWPEQSIHTAPPPYPHGPWGPYGPWGPRWGWGWRGWW